MEENTISQAGTPHRILVVDSHADIRQLSSEVLVKSGYHVDAAEDGAAAWQALNGDHYDLMITSHKLPKVSGIELLKKLRAVRMALPVIMAVPALPDEVSTRILWSYPAVTLLMPYTVDEFLGMVREVLRVSTDTPNRSRRRQSARASPLPMVGSCDHSYRLSAVG